MNVVCCALTAVVLFGCSIKRMAVNKIGDSLTSGVSVYETDSDIELVGGALPFSLKLLETLLAESPRHAGLLLSLCKGYTMYSYVYVHQEADRVADTDLARYREVSRRASKLYLRGLAYGLRGLEVSYPGISEKLLRQPDDVLERVKKKDVPLLYWSAAALGLGISASRTDAELLARVPEVDALLERALALDETWQEGTVHEFKLILASARPSFSAIDPAPMKIAYQRALELSGGKRASLFVAYAEAVSVQTQNRAEFKAELEKALAIDPEKHETLRFSNAVSQRRARWLLARVDELFL